MVKIEIGEVSLDDDYRIAQKVIQLLIKHKIVKSHLGEGAYLNLWDASLEIAEMIDEVNERAIKEQQG